MNHDDHQHHHSKGVDPSHMNPETQAICPVTGDIVNKVEAEQAGLVRTYTGQTYYLCCAGCIQPFKEHPKNYVHGH